MLELEKQVCKCLRLWTAAGWTSFLIHWIITTLQRAAASRKCRL